MFQNTPSEITFYYIVGTTFIIILVVAIILYIIVHQKKVTAFQLTLKEEQLQRQLDVYAALQEGEEKERNRIAIELHDGISAKLSGLNMNLDHVCSEANGNKNLLLLNKTHAGISDVINELRELSHNLKPLDLRGKTLESSLCDYIEQLQSKNQCLYSLHVDTALIRVDKTVEMHCYRIITELLSNVHKHAKATIASVQLQYEDDKVRLTVEDNGIGFNPNIDTSKGIGLRNVLNRVTVCRGQMSIDSSTKGSTVFIDLPLK